jgi:hypothetical protein
MRRPSVEPISITVVPGRCYIENLCDWDFAFHASSYNPAEPQWETVFPERVSNRSNPPGPAPETTIIDSGSKAIRPYRRAGAFFKPDKTLRRGSRFDDWEVIWLGGWTRKPALLSGDGCGCAKWKASAQPRKASASSPGQSAATLTSLIGRYSGRGGEPPGGAAYAQLRDPSMYSLHRRCPPLSEIDAPIRARIIACRACRIISAIPAPGGASGRGPSGGRPSRASRAARRFQKPSILSRFLRVSSVSPTTIPSRFSNLSTRLRIVFICKPLGTLANRASVLPPLGTTDEPGGHRRNADRERSTP